MRPSYLKNAALLTGADVVLRLAGMGLRIWLANALGGEGMGLYQLVLAVYSLFVTLATSGVSVAATRLMAEELSRSRAEARGMLLRLLGAALLGADQWVKAWVMGHLQMGETTSLFPGFLELMRVHNYGAAWSSFAGQKWLLLGVTGVILAVVLWVLARKIVRHPLGICACCLILSGGIGNIIDRLRLGYVVDMLHFQFWPSYPTFNVADVCIVSGAILGAIYYVLLYEKHDRRKTDGASDPANGQ